jgi:phosphoacetylglucosamine mutase
MLEVSNDFSILVIIIEGLTIPDSNQQTWEAQATKLANADNDDVFKTYKTIAELVKAPLEEPARVVFARDTRASGSTLVAALVDALNATGTEFVDYKLLTTPQLHYIVRSTNTYGTDHYYGEISEVGYYEKMAKAFKQALGPRAKISGSVTVDCANGVGGPKLREMIKYLPSAADGGIDIKIVNDDVVNPEALNVQVTSIMTSSFSCYNADSHVLTVRCRLCQDSAACPAKLKGWPTRSLRFFGR